MNQKSIIQMIRNGQNPEQVTLNILNSTLGGTPMGNNLMNLAKEQNTQELEKIARNLLGQKGLNYDKELAAFKKMFGL